ncbi:carboxypeptidase regulatory-like domain-containing protein [Marinibactrum halimedae]|uniref:TonB-dependent transporter Oar-like beta-barrel domain-containing protein n=1 Tax=Marinibactrum halimedae TaxID=1444977 RepID=A0AA37T5E7_9GAMM|nr:carboxypeptidase regulatory-like domain-containing protein [Marinibactrum halimedae]MCD9460485.1 carboxypeptidase regulatory-like domain-containing protein [Marinibactrum halimedae]GLS25891.1 hypothetical protein GCM10007877_16050 [Marinibactrum halimedae]
MKFLNRKSLAAAVLVAIGSTGAIAQETSSSIRGKILDTDGTPLENASISVVDTRTGVTRTYSTNNSGSFIAPRLPVGGPYNVIINGKQKVEVTSIGLGDVFKLNYTMQASQQNGIEEVIVEAEAYSAETVAAGPSAVFGLYEMETAVSFGRDIADVYALDPRISIDPSGGVNCGGKHPRFNSTTLDGVSQNDRFGLNNNGYSTATGMPFPFDAVEQISVELAPFDVAYGNFTACNINAVTKSGSNEFHGGAFYDVTNESLRGDSVGDGQDLSSPDYDEFRRGFNVSGPIIQDKLFFSLAYEESEAPEFTAMGFDGSGSGVERPWLSQSDYNRILDIAQNQYGYNPGGQPGNGTLEDKKYLVRLDYNINENHDLAFTYNYYDGSQLRSSDGDRDEFEFSNHFYTKGSESETYTIKYSAQWTDIFSTEIFYSNNTMDDSQVTIGDPSFGDMQIEIDNNTVYLGADDSRQANGLNTESDYFKFSAQLLAGDHLISGGYEREALSIFNLFVQHSRGGEYDFNDGSASNPDYCDALTAAQRQSDPGCGLSGIDRFELGAASFIYYGSGGGTNVAADAAASFENVLHTFYVQDEYYFADIDLTLVGGLRYERFESDDSPNENPTFTDAYGFSNTGTIDGVDLLMPRLGFTWGFSDQTTFRGGVGLFSGGNPNVWLSNAWSNDGLTNVQIDTEDLFGEDMVPSVFGGLPLSGAGRPGFDVPQALVDFVAGVTPSDASNSRVVSIDPNYEQPSEWKFAFGGTHEFNNGITADFDILYSVSKNSAYYVDITQEIKGYTQTGTPIYGYIDRDTLGSQNLMLTNSDEDAESLVFSASLNKSFDFGLDVSVGYSSASTEDISPMTSSTAGSNFQNTALRDINDPQAGTSNYEVPHRFTLNLTYTKEFISGLETRVTLSGWRQAGQATSYTMSSDDLEGRGPRSGRHLLYVPTGADDSNVVFADTFDQDAFFQWASDEGLGSGYVSRNSAEAKWSTLFNLRLEQELPTFIDDTYGSVYLKVYNLGNLLNDEWGHQNDAAFFSQEIVDVSVNDNGQYVFNSFSERDPNDFDEQASLWEIQVGARFMF